jgi:dienelactone hydrolase
MVTYRNFSDMERPLRGEQLESFEYVFSPKGPDGAPLRLWNRDTGEVNTDVAASWKPYDIGRTLRTRWKELAPDLAGKIHVIMGDDDTFYLEGACRLLKKDLEAMGADASVRMLPGDHGTVLTKAVRESINKGMADAWRKVRGPKSPSP